MMNLIEKMEEIKRYGHIDQIHWDRAHFQRGASGAVSLHIPITTHTNKQRRENIQVDINAAAQKGQRVEVKTDPFGGTQGYVRLHQKLTRKTAEELEYQLKKRGVTIISQKGLPWENIKVQPRDSDQKPTGSFEITEFKADKSNWPEN